jgi:hypothetical protein
MTSIEGQRVSKGQQTTDDQAKQFFKKKFRFKRGSVLNDWPSL